MSKCLKNRYTWLCIAAICIAMLSHFDLINHATAMYMVGVAFGWSWGYDYCKESMKRAFDAMFRDCGYCDCQKEESSNNNSE